MGPACPGLFLFFPFVVVGIGCLGLLSWISFSGSGIQSGGKEGIVGLEAVFPGSAVLLYGGFWSVLLRVRGWCLLSTPLVAEFVDLCSCRGLLWGESGSCAVSVFCRGWPDWGAFMGCMFVWGTGVGVESLLLLGGGEMR